MTSVLTAVEVLRGQAASSIVALGDSITDGWARGTRRSPPDAHAHRAECSAEWLRKSSQITSVTSILSERGPTLRAGSRLRPPAQV